MSVVAPILPAGSTTSSVNVFQQPATHSIAYSMPAGCHVIPAEELDLRPDAEIDAAIMSPPPISLDSEKNIFFFWHSGYENCEY